MKAEQMMSKRTIGGHEYSVDPTNGLCCVSVIQSWYDHDDFDWAIPEGYVEYQALYIGRDAYERHCDNYVVWFGTLAEVIAARTDGHVRFIPATDEEAA